MSKGVKYRKAQKEITFLLTMLSGVRRAIGDDVIYDTYKDDPAGYRIYLLDLIDRAMVEHYHTEGERLVYKGGSDGFGN